MSADTDWKERAALLEGRLRVALDELEVATRGRREAEGKLRDSEIRHVALWSVTKKARAALLALLEAAGDQPDLPAPK